MAEMTTGYIDLTIRVYPEADQYVGECLELGVASCGDTVEEAARNAVEATELYLNAIERTGERERTFREQGITLRSGEPPTEDVVRTVPARPHEFVTTQSVRIPIGA